MKFLPILTVLILMTSFSLLQAQDSTSTSGLQIGGSVDGYFRANLGADYDVAPGTSFSNLSGFALGMANLTFSKEGKKAGFMADLVVGPRGEDATFLSPFLRPGGTSSIINQLYVFVNLSDKVKATLGNFNTFLGYEIISPTGNFNYSTSYMFSYGPFSHTGLKFDFELPGGFTAMAGVFNPTDATEFNPIDDYVGGLQLGYSFDKGSVLVNSLFDDDFFQIDLTAGFDVTDKVYFGVNATSASDNFYGAAAYIQAQVTEPLKIGTRIEYFSDEGLDLFETGEDENIIDITLSANYTIGGLTLIPEIRFDVASQSVFTDDTDTNKSLTSFVLAAVYGF